MSEVPLYPGTGPPQQTLEPLAHIYVFQETSARYRAVEPSSGSNVIPRRARPGLAGLRPHNIRELPLRAAVRSRSKGWRTLRAPAPRGPPQQRLEPLAHIMRPGDCLRTRLSI